MSSWPRALGGLAQADLAPRSWPSLGLEGLGCERRQQGGGTKGRMPLTRPFWNLASADDVYNNLLDRSFGGVHPHEFQDRHRRHFRLFPFLSEPLGGSRPNLLPGGAGDPASRVPSSPISRMSSFISLVTLLFPLP